MAWQPAAKAQLAKSTSLKLWQQRSTCEKRRTGSGARWRPALPQLKTALLAFHKLLSVGREEKFGWRRREISSAWAAEDVSVASIEHRGG